MWPGFGDNMRVLEWVINHIKGDVESNKTAIGDLPHLDDINTSGLDTDKETMDALLEVDSEAWLIETEQIREYLQSYGDRLPNQMLVELDKVAEALKATA